MRCAHLYVEPVPINIGVDRKDVVVRQAGRREKNTPRRVAIYCGQRFGRCRHKDLAKYFGLSHAGSVSSTIVSVGRQLETGELEKEIKQIQRKLNVVKLPRPLNSPSMVIEIEVIAILDT